jgi:cytochrome c oxidase subunit 3
MAAHGASAPPAHHEEGLTNSMLGFILFIASEVMFFGGLFAAYFIARADSAQWPPHDLLERLKEQGEIAQSVELKLELPLPLIATVLLVLSSFTIQYGVMQIARGNRSGMIWWFFVSLVLGVVFLTMQMYDYSQLEFGAGDTIYGTTFYTLTGFHGAHVAGGAIFMLVILMRALGGQFTAQNHEAVEACSLYWHFVDVVWIALFTTIYIFGR